MNFELPKCANCGKPVTRSFHGTWRHHYTTDYEGPCYWGKPHPDEHISDQ
jgi:hypothetical protein